MDLTHTDTSAAEPAATSNPAPDRLPYDIGYEAYHLRKRPEENPYPAGSWQRDEWDYGWGHAEKSDDSQAWDWANDCFRPGV